MNLINKIFDWIRQNLKKIIWGGLFILYIFFSFNDSYEDKKELLCLILFYVLLLAIGYILDKVLVKNMKYPVLNDFLFGMAIVSSILLISITFDIYEFCVGKDYFLNPSLFLYFIYTMYGQICLVRKRPNAVFLIRCVLLAYMFILAIILYNNIYSGHEHSASTISDILSEGWLIPIIHFALMALCIKGFLNTFSKDVEKAFPKSERRIPYADILILLLIFYSVVFNYI